MALAVIVMVGMVVAVAGGSCRDDNVLMQIDQDRGGRLATTATTTIAACVIKPLPCGDPNFANFPLQVINREGPKRATFNVLNLNDGSYTDVCDVPGAELNGCGINPIDDAIYCVTADGANTQFVRVQCAFPPGYDPSSGPITGELCFFGKSDRNFAATFDPFTGDYIYKTNGGEIDRVKYVDIAMYTGYASAADANAAGPSQVSKDNLVTNNPLNKLADFDIAKFTAGTLFGGVEQLFLVGCRDNKVFLQSLTNTANFAEVTMTDYGTSPTGQSGASWLFRGNTTNPDVYCAYNDGVNGVIQVNVTQIFTDGMMTDRIPTGFVSPSEKTNSNDGLNCEKAESPFGPPRTVTTTTTTTTTTMSTSTTSTTMSTETTTTTTTTMSTETTSTTMSTSTTTTTMSTSTTTTTMSTSTTTTTMSTSTTTTTMSTTTTTTTTTTMSTETTTTTMSTETTTTTMSTETTTTTMSTETTTTTMSTETTTTTETTATAPDPGSSSTVSTTSTSTTTSTDEPTTTNKPYGQHRRHRRFRRFLPFRRHGRHGYYDQHGYRYS